MHDLFAMQVNEAIGNSQNLKLRRSALARCFVLAILKSIPFWPYPTLSYYE